MPELTTTSYAILGQLALRPWSMYEMAKNIGRTLHWFWPRAESLIYAEAKRLVARRLAQTERQQVGARPRTVYAITPAGRDALRAWLTSQPEQGFSFHFEPLLRVHLAPYGTREDLLRALESAQTAAEALLGQAVFIAQEFLEERHQFQEQVHVRAILFDFLWEFGLTMYLWAERSRVEVEGWTDLELSDKAERALQVMRRAIEAQVHKGLAAPP